MDASFTPSPHKEAVALLAGKKPIASDVFHQLLPELRARAFTVAGVTSVDVLQSVRDSIAAILQGEMTWDEAKKQIVDDLDPWLGDGAEARATTVLRVNTYQAFSNSIYNAAQADDDTTHLQYIHGACAVPTPSHEALNGIVLPKDDPFWNTHTGPWGHLGCVCSVIPMNQDLVDDEKAMDEDKSPENKNVLTGATARALQHNNIIRNGRHYNVSPTGPDNTGFTWQSGNLRIPLKELEKRYDPQVWSQFQDTMQKENLSKNQSVWDWLNESK